MPANDPEVQPAPDNGAGNNPTEDTLLVDTPAAAATSIGTGSPPANDNPSPSATLIVNGNNPAQWPLNQIWNYNLGALFSHDGISETVYSTSTMDTTVAGTTTVEYWAHIPSSQDLLHATRDVVIHAAANDNAASSSPPAANDNSPPLDATITNATSTQ